MLKLGNELRYQLDGGLLAGVAMYRFHAQVISLFTEAGKFGIWVPDRRVFEFNPERVMNLFTTYLTHVGTMLADKHFREAKQVADSSKEAFALAFFEHEKAHPK